MSAIQNLVVPLDGSELAERALVPAAKLASVTGANVVIVTARIGGVTVEPRHYLQDAAARAGIDDPEVVVVDDRLAASALALVAEEHAESVVCMATHARGGAGQALFGSVTEEALQLLAGPMLLVGPSVVEPSELEELVVCVDGSRLAATIVPVAASWAETLRIPATVLGVADGGLPAGVSADQLEHEVAAAARALEPRAEKVDTSVVSGVHVADEITRFLRNRPGRFVALATHGRTGLARMTGGSVMMAVVRDAPCPVLTARSHRDVAAVPEPA